MRAILLCVALVLAGCGKQAEPPVGFAGLSKQTLHAKGQCGTMKPGTGLTWWPDGTVRGEVTSMLPGMTFFRMRGPGTVTLTWNKVKEIDFKPEDFHTIVIEGAAKDSVLEWKPAMANNWTKVPTPFLYPREVTQAQIDVDNAIKYDLPIPGINRPASYLMSRPPTEPGGRSAPRPAPSASDRPD